MNLANSYHHSRQMTTEASRGTFLIPYKYKVRAGVGYLALSILCDEGNARAYDSRMGSRADTYAFFVLKANLKQMY